MKRRSLLKAAAAAPFLTLAAPALVRAQSQTTLRFIPQSDLAFLDPHIVASWAPRNHAHMVFDSLYGLNDQYRPAAQMSAGHSVENDGKLWKITLREGLLWHDGHPVRAADCVASIKRWGVRHSFGQLLMAATDELSAPDDKTIQFRLKQPFPMLIEALSPVTGPMCAMMPERLAQTDPVQADPRDHRQRPVPLHGGPARARRPQRLPQVRPVRSASTRRGYRVDCRPEDRAFRRGGLEHHPRQRHGRRGAGAGRAGLVGIRQPGSAAAIAVEQRHPRPGDRQVRRAHLPAPELAASAVQQPGRAPRGDGRHRPDDVHAIHHVGRRAVQHAAGLLLPRHADGERCRNGRADRAARHGPVEEGAGAGRLQGRESHPDGRQRHRLGSRTFAMWPPT